MKTPARLFMRRMKVNLALQKKALSFITDAASIIYIGIPIILFVIAYYRSIIINPPQWLNEVTPAMIAIVYIIIFALQQYRSFYEYADQLFLSHKRSWLTSIKRCSVMYNIILSLIINTILITLLLPVLVRTLDHSFSYLFILLLNNSFFMVVISLIKRRIYAINRLLIKMIAYVIFAVAATAAYIELMKQDSIIMLVVSASWLGILLLTYYISLGRQTTDSNFISYTAYDLQSRYRLIGSLLKQLNIKVDMKRKVNQKPSIFKKSQPIFKKRTTSHILAETFLKSWLRRPQFYQMVCYAIAYSSFGMFQLDQTGKLVFLVLITLFLSITLKSSWSIYFQEDFINLLKIDEQQKLHGFRLINICITAVVLGCIVVITLFFLETITSIIIHLVISIVTYTIAIVAINKVNAR